MKAITWFLCEQVRPRLGQVFRSADMGLTLVAALAIFVLSRSGAPLDANRLSALDVVPHILTYAAIGGGFALSGLTVASTFPPTQFLRFMAARSQERGKPPKQPAEDLWFVFAWAATTHLLLVLMALVMLGVRGYPPLMTSGDWPSWRAGVGAIAAAATFYCVLRFLVTIVTVIQVADIYLEHVLESRAPGEESGDSAEGESPKRH